MNEKLLNINKTKYRYLMDNLDLSKERPIIKYCIPVPRGEEKPTDEFFDRDYPDVTISNKKFVKMIDKTAKALLSYGVKKGDIVTICQTNTPEIIYMDYALNKIGAIPNYIYPNVTAEEMRYYLDELNSKYMFILDDAPIRKNVKQALKGTDIKVISSSVIESFPKMFKLIASKKMPAPEKVYIPNEIKWDDFIRQGKSVKDVKENPYIPNDTCSFVHSSGTSSVPKAIEDSNENNNAISYYWDIQGLPVNCNYTNLQTIPQFVEYGKTFNHSGFCHNICMIFIPEMEPKNYYDLIKKYRPQLTHTTPSHIRELIKRPVNMSSFIYGSIGGDNFSDVEDIFNNYMKQNKGNISILQGYGASEASAVVTMNTPSNYKKGSLGKLYGNVKGILVEPDTFNIITKPNIIGELCITGVTLTKGYAGNSKSENEGVFVKHPDGQVYMHIGDYISMDEDGFLFYHGRIKNVIARKSFKFAPKEIEDAIASHVNVKQCVVIGKYDKEEGQVPSAHIVLNDNDDIEKTVEEIIELVNANVQEFHRPTVYKIKPSIVITRNNKVNINALKIEDIATIPDGINDAEISLSNDTEYDYDLKIYCDNKINEQEVIDFIEQTSKNEKVLNGKIKYSFVNEKGKSYVKYV